VVSRFGLALGRSAAGAASQSASDGAPVHDTHLSNLAPSAVQRRELKLDVRNARRSSLCPTWPTCPSYLGQSVALTICGKREAGIYITSPVEIKVGQVGPVGPAEQTCHLLASNLRLEVGRVGRGPSTARYRAQQGGTLPPPPRATHTCDPPTRSMIQTDVAEFRCNLVTFTARVCGLLSRHIRQINAGLLSICRGGSLRPQEVTYGLAGSS
jgi:hypothetical protein